MPATINGTTGFGGNLTGNVTGNVTGTSSAVADGAVSAAKLDGAQSGSAPVYGCRAWVNFDGTTVTNVGGEDRCAIRASGNVSKVVRSASGQYAVHLTTAMPDANGCVTINGSLGNPFADMLDFFEAHISSSSVIQIATYNSAYTNAAHVHVAIFR